MNNLTFGNKKYQYYETICSGSPAGPISWNKCYTSSYDKFRLTDPEILELSSQFTKRFPY